MSARRILVPLLAYALVALSAGACVHARHAGTPETIHRKHGPPPWAPAHGYRHKHAGGVELVFDSALGVYVVVGLPNHYFHGDRFYRYADGRWMIGIAADGPWVHAEWRDLPAGLQKPKAKKHGKKGRGRSSGPASMP